MVQDAGGIGQGSAGFGEDRRATGVDVGGRVPHVTVLRCTFWWMGKKWGVSVGSISNNVAGLIRLDSMSSDAFDCRLDRDGFVKHINATIHSLDGGNETTKMTFGLRGGGSLTGQRGQLLGNQHDVYFEFCTFENWVSMSSLL